MIKTILEYAKTMTLGFISGVCIVAAITYVSYLGSQQRVYDQIYVDIQEAYGDYADGVPLIIEDNKDINAYTDGDKIVIWSGIVGLMGDDRDAIALLIAHEFSHVMLQHPDSMQCRLDSQSCEQQADRLARILVTRAGYDACKGAKLLFGNLAWVFDDMRTESEDTHPAPLERAADMCSIPF